MKLTIWHVSGVGRYTLDLLGRGGTIGLPPRTTTSLLARYSPTNELQTTVLALVFAFRLLRYYVKGVLARAVLCRSEYPPLFDGNI